MSSTSARLVAALIPDGDGFVMVVVFEFYDFGDCLLPKHVNQTVSYYRKAGKRAKRFAICLKTL